MPAAKDMSVKCSLETQNSYSPEEKENRGGHRAQAPAGCGYRRNSFR
jgi:hypothetical protein